MKNTSIKKGFTLIELLVVIAIIAILSSIILVSLMGPRSKARDAKRISDVSQLQLALEQYFNKNQAYPSNLSGVSPAYISTLPKDPKTNADYDYRVDASNYYDYFIHATLENLNEVIKDGLAATPSYGSGVACSNNSATSKDYCVGPK